VTAGSLPFPKHAAAFGRSLLAEGVDEALCRQLLALVETEPQAVAEQVRAWLSEERS
jgi:flagellar biosynthesis/type III secretory pathway M-ring protein FliF/YscJ